MAYVPPFTLEAGEAAATAAGATAITASTGLPPVVSTAIASQITSKVKAALKNVSSGIRTLLGKKPPSAQTIEDLLAYGYAASLSGAPSTIHKPRKKGDNGRHPAFMQGYEAANRDKAAIEAAIKGAVASRKSPEEVALAAANAVASVPASKQTELTNYVMGRVEAYGGSIAAYLTAEAIAEEQRKQDELMAKAKAEALARAKAEAEAMARAEAEAKAIAKAKAEAAERARLEAERNIATITTPTIGPAMPIMPPPPMPVKPPSADITTVGPITSEITGSSMTPIGMSAPGVAPVEAKEGENLAKQIPEEGNPFLLFTEAQLAAEKEKVESAIAYRQSKGLSADGYKDMTLVQLYTKRALIMAAYTPILIKKYGLYAIGGLGLLLMYTMSRRRNK